MKLLKTTIIFCLLPFSAWAKDISASEIDDIVNEAMDVFSVPGIAVGIIQNGRVFHAKGYGVTALNNGADVDEHTYFGIASNSKGFTATALAILVEEEKIAWDDPVKKYLPEFEMWDPYVTENFTIRDLLSHHTGLPLGSGDLMWWPDANYPADEVIRNMRYLKPNRGFRTTYAYNNTPFIVAGAIIPAVTGKSYQDFLQERIFSPLNMDRCTANTPKMANDKNLTEPHAVLDGTLQQVKRYLILDQVVGSMAAAGIQCSVDDLLKWEMMHLRHGEGLMKARTHDALWQVNTPIAVTSAQMESDKTHFRGYGLGYSLNDYHGVKVISHNGGLVGMYSHLTMVPELDFAIAITTNQQSGSAYNVIKTKILNLILDVKDTHNAADIFAHEQKQKKDEQKRIAALKGNDTPSLDLMAYTGPYHDKWWEDVDITLEDGKLYFASRRSPSLRGYLDHFEENTFIVRWDDRTHEADAFVYFSMNAKSNITGFTMKAVSNRTDFSYDFHHVNMMKK